MKDEGIERRRESRRSFLWQAGTVVGAGVATGVPLAAAAGDHPWRIRLARLEDLEAIRALHRAYVAQVNAGSPEAGPGSFATDLAIDLEVAGAGTVQAFLPRDPSPDDTIEVAPDRRTATARFRCTARTPITLVGEGSLLDMARQQGVSNGRTREIVVEHACVRESDVWRIQRVTYRA